MRAIKNLSNKFYPNECKYAKQSIYFLKKKGQIFPTVLFFKLIYSPPDSVQYYMKIYFFDINVKMLFCYFK